MIVRRGIRNTKWVVDLLKKTDRKYFHHSYEFHKKIHEASSWITIVALLCAEILKGDSSLFFTPL
jgi:hypothetical protein